MVLTPFWKRAVIPCMLYQNWAASYSFHVCLQDESHRPDKSAYWMCLLPDTALPEGPGFSLTWQSHPKPPCSATRSPQKRGKQKLHDLLPWRYLYFRNGRSRLTVHTIRKIWKSSQSPAQSQRECCSAHPSMWQGKNCNCTAGHLILLRFRKW